MNVNSAYGKAAVLALVQWNGMSQEDAVKFVQDKPFDVVEGECYAKGSVENGFNALLATFEKKGVIFTEEQKKALWEEMINGEGQALEELKSRISSIGLDPAELAVEAGTVIHDKWVEDSAKKFNQFEPKRDSEGEPKFHPVTGEPIMIDRRQKLYMHNPTELIGVTDFFLDYVFLKPVMESMGVQVDDNNVAKEYWKKQAEFVKKLGLRSLDDLKALIMSPEVADYYESVRNYPKGKIALFRTEQFVERMIDQMNRDGLLEMFIKGQDNDISKLGDLGDDNFDPNKTNDPEATIEAVKRAKEKNPISFDTIKGAIGDKKKDPNISE